MLTDLPITMFKSFALWAILLWPTLGFAQFTVPLNTSPVSLSLSGCDAAYAHGFSGLGNPACLALSTSPQVGMLFEQRYGLSQLSTKGLAAHYPSKWGTVGLAGSQFGITNYQSSRYSLSYSRTFAGKVSGGFQMNVRDEYQLGNTHVTAIYSNVGLVYSPTSQLSIGAHCYNPEQAKLSFPSVDVPLPTYFEMGINWRILQHTKLLAEIEQYLGFQTQVSAAFESTYKNIVAIRAGYRLTENQFSWGVGTRFKNLLADVGFSYQMPLGMVSGVSLSWEFSQPKQ